MESKSKERSNKNIQFEDTLNSLEKIVSELESGNLSLNDCIDKFESGVTLYNTCKKLLGSAEKRISILTESLKEEEFCE